MTRELEDMSDDARSLLRAEKTVGPAPGKARVAGRLDATLFGPGGPGGGPGGGEGTGASARPAADAPAPTPGAPVTAAAAVASGARWASHLLVGVTGLAVGVALTVTLRKPDVVQAPPTVVSVYVDRAPPSNAVSLTPTFTTPTASTSASVAPSASAPTAPPSSTQSTRADDTAAERALLDPARTALGKNDGPSAMEGVHKHEQRFPKGQLTEEREAIAIQALVLLGNGPEAQARAARFKRTYPNSVLAPAVDAALQAIK